MCASGKVSQHKKYKCRHYDEEADRNIPYWNGGKE
jgi:hypothetical protein